MASLPPAPTITRTQTPALLKGIIFGGNGKAMAPSHTRKKGRLYRYYVNMDAIKMGREGSGMMENARLSADLAEAEKINKS